jgi:hypothetical protein
VVDGGVVVVGAEVVGDGVAPQAPRSRHSEAASTGFQPAPGGGVCATSAWYRCPWYVTWEPTTYGVPSAHAGAEQVTTAPA